MPTSELYRFLKENYCDEVGVSVTLKLQPSVLNRLRACLEGKRRNLPYDFGKAYPGTREERVGATGQLSRGEDKDTFNLTLVWFLVDVDPPKEFGKLDDLIECVREPFGHRLVWSWIQFSYDAKHFQSFVLPIQMREPLGVFDEIVELTGVKKSPEGKSLYELDVSLRANRLRHTVRFVQTVTLSEDLPMTLVESARRISTVALKQKE